MTIRPAERFSALISRSPGVGLLLPLAHTTDGWGLREIMAAGRLRAQHCKVFNEDLLYFFYGRPAYAPNPTKLAVSLFASHLICFVIRSEASPAPKRIFPFDTGAAHGGLYSPYFHPGMPLLNFAIQGKTTAARKIVKVFYGNNDRYYLGKTLVGKKFKALELEAEGFHALITANGETDPDHRRGSIEVQFDMDVGLTQRNVMAVVMPQSRGDDMEIKEFIEDGLKADRLYYDWYHMEPAKHVGQIMSEVRRYFRGKGILP